MVTFFISGLGSPVVLELGWGLEFEVLMAGIDGPGFGQCWSWDGVRGRVGLRSDLGLWVGV